MGRLLLKKQIRQTLIVSQEMLTAAMAAEQDRKLFRNQRLNPFTGEIHHLFNCASQTDLFRCCLHFHNLRAPS